MGLFAKHMSKETIYALSSPQGKSAIAIIRLSGSLSFNTVQAISSNMPKKQNTPNLNNILDRDNSIIDQTLTTFFKAPKSFTGEDMVEITAHGGGAVIKKILSRLSGFKKVRIANPGEFTRRAYENNKLDLTQVEAIADVVNAETEIQRKQAISHLSGSFFKSSKKIFENLKKSLANIEAVIDFSDEDLPENLTKQIKEQIENNLKKIKSMLQGSSMGISIRKGFVITILGKTNTGKSSFINMVSGKDVAIVTNQPGTTRDLIESFVDIDGYPFRFVDTAGIRESKDIVEEIGVKKALSLSEESNINLVFIDSDEDICEFKDIKNPIFVRSKQDITKAGFKEGVFYNISSKTQFGSDALFKVIKEKISQDMPPESIYISRERHIACLKMVEKHLTSSQKEKTVDLLAEDVRRAIKSLESLFGNVDIEDILDIIFSDFCIGK